MNVPVLRDFLNDVPLPITALLLRLSPHLAFIRLSLLSLSWHPPFHNSWLLLAAWCFLCLFADLILRYLLPLFVLLIVTIHRLCPKTPQPLVNELVLQSTIADLQTISSLLPSLPTFPDGYTLARVLLLLYIPYRILMWCVPLRILIAAVGAGFITYRAPWAIVLRRVVWRSAYFRWSIYYLWSQLSGQPLLHHAPHETAVSSTQPVNTLRFLFTVYENQRWWMGLDWTAALLPGERPSWCSPAQHPVSPPNAFSLPKTTAVILASPDGKKVKRTAVWRWEEPEWRVVVRKIDSGITRVERPLPSVEKETGSRLLKGKRQDSVDQSNPSGIQEDQLGEVESAGVEDHVTDPDGWVYGDNKWENLSNKGGMSKYTRSRRWTRIATVQEVVEEVDGDQNEGILAGSTDSLNSAMPDATAGNQFAIESNQRQETSPLRQRLINTVKQPSSNSRDEQVIEKSNSIL